MAYRILCVQWQLQVPDVKVQVIHGGESAKTIEYHTNEPVTTRIVV